MCRKSPLVPGGRGVRESSVPVRHNIAGAAVWTSSDIAIPYLTEDSFRLFESREPVADVWNFIQLVDLTTASLPGLTTLERDALSRSKSFPRRWLDSPVFQCQEVRDALDGMLTHLDQVDVELAWNRCILRDFARCEQYLFYPPERQRDFASPLFVAGYRNLVRTMLPRFSTVLVHAAGVLRRDRVALFLAPDEGGKSTVVRTVPDASVLSDDHLALRLEGEGVVAYATPFGPVTGGPVRAGIGGVFVLEKAGRFELRSIDRNSVLKLLWEDQTHPLAVVPAAFRKSAFEVLHRASREAPAYSMQFTRDWVDWDAIDAAMVQTANA